MRNHILHCQCLIVPFSLETKDDGYGGGGGGRGGDWGLGDVKVRFDNKWFSRFYAAKRLRVLNFRESNILVSPFHLLSGYSAVLLIGWRELVTNSSQSSRDDFSLQWDSRRLCRKFYQSTEKFSKPSHEVSTRTLRRRTFLEVRAWRQPCLIQLQSQAFRERSGECSSWSADHDEHSRDCMILYYDFLPRFASNLMGSNAFHQSLGSHVSHVHVNPHCFEFFLSGLIYFAIVASCIFCQEYVWRRVCVCFSEQGLGFIWVGNACYK